MQSAPEPPYRPPDRRVLDWVGARLATDVLRVDRLTGGITSDVDRLTLAGDRPPVVLRRWSDTGTWLERLVEREAASLTALAATTIPAPHLLAADPDGEDAGVPSVVMSHVPGEVVLAPRDPGVWLDDLARVQATVHRLAPTLTARAVHQTTSPDLDWLPDAGLRRECLAVVELAARGTPDDVFAHGDFQPFNVLWRDGRLSGVVDWPSAGTGPRGRDVGHCCLNLAVLFDADVAVDHLRRYEAASDLTVDPVVVTRALLAWDPSWQGFIPRQVAGRARVDTERMAERVVATIRCVLQRSG